jgi:superfamily II DNA or RNA helicase
MPVARLKETTEGRVRINLVEDAGFATVDSVLQAGRQRLRRIHGVGEETATKVVAAARQLRTALTETVRLRFDVERRPESHAALLTELATWREIESLIDPARDDLSALAPRLGELLEAAAPARGRLRLLVAGRKRRAAARAALEQLDGLIHNERTAQLAETAEAVVAVEPSTAVGIWDEYAQDAVGFNGLLIEVGGLAPDEQQVHGQLPQELVDRISQHPLDTSLLDVALRGYQAFGARFALTQERSIIGDEMGLGKTIEALAAVCHVASEGGSHFLVVCPASVLVNWDHELRNRTSLLRARLHGADRVRVANLWKRRGGVAVTTFDSLKALPDLQLSVDMLVVDEAHYIKNPAAQRTAAVQRWIARASRTLYLTGTPMENRVEEFRTLVSHLQPGVAERVRAIDGLAGAETFRRAVAPVYLRRNQDDVLDELPPRIETEEWIDLEGDDLAAYRDAVAAGNFMAMRRAAYAPGTITGSAKLARLVEIVEEAGANDRKVVIFSFFRDVLAAVAQVLGERVIGTISGSVAPIERQQIVDRFSESLEPVVLVSQIQAGGVGLNIQAASVVILTEPQWKPTVEEQAIARSHRLGQIRPVDVHRLLAEDSVDERMLEVLAGKAALFSEYVRRSDLKDATPDAVDVSGVEETREVASQAEDERHIIEREQRKFGFAVTPAGP